MDLDAESFGSEVLECELPVLVDFWSQTCPHCLKLAPQFDAAREQHGEQVKFVKVAVQDARPLFSEYKISAVPTLILFLNGNEVARRQGAASAEEIGEWLAENMG
jgi:thioredoxin